MSAVEATGTTPLGSITDVPGLRVGHHERTGRGWQSGTTVVMVPGGATPGVDVRGGGPGTRETDALAAHNLVDTVHAVCLTGGSAYGLAAADGVMAVLEARGDGVPVGPEPGHVVPVVPTAVIFDLGRGGRFGNRPDAGFGERAARRAAPDQSRWGAVGAGTGACARGLQGGVGTAAVTVTVPADGDSEPVEVVVGALAVVNANGTPVDPATGLPWERTGLTLTRVAGAERAALRTVLDPGADPGTTGTAPPSLNTTIGVVATSARLTKAEAGKLAAIAHDGLARAIRPAHSMVDGDTIFALATGGHELPTPGGGLHGEHTPRPLALNALLAAAAETFAAACTHAVVSARTIGAAPAYRDVCPSAFAGAR